MRGIRSVFVLFWMGLLVIANGCYQLHVRTHIYPDQSVYREIQLIIPEQTVYQLQAMAQQLAADDSAGTPDSHTTDILGNLDSQCYHDLGWRFSSEVRGKNAVYTLSQTFTTVDSMITALTRLEACDKESGEMVENQPALFQVMYEHAGQTFTYREQVRFGNDRLSHATPDSGLSPTNQQMHETLRQMVIQMMDGFEYSFDLILPHKIQGGNASEVFGNMAHWRYSLDDLVNGKSFEAVASYTVTQVE
ncbi:MAG: hypothetical protein D6675_10860 [Gemmatimonadetes bacterium]|nr:MAG: hypothetical protein D6675_10860 [Gemmatimonadota bacterium]